MHRSIGHLARALLLSAPAALRAWAGARSSRKNSSPACRRRLEKLSSQAGGIVRIRSASFHLRISVRFRLLRESSDRICRPSPRTLHRSGLHRCEYVLPQKPGYSIQVRPETLEQFAYAPRRNMGRPAAKRYLFVCKCCCQHLTLFHHLNIGETIVGRHTHEIQKARTTS